MSVNSNRRSFFGKAAAAAGAATAMTGTDARAQVRKTSPDFIRIGFACVGSNSHAGLWAPAINPVKGDKWPGRTTNMLITHCWDSRPEAAQNFAKRYDCVAVKNFEDMVGKVDAVIFGGFFEAPWWEKLTQPYLEAGIPTYIDRPIGLNMKTAKSIVERAKRYKTPIMSCDAHGIMEEAFLSCQKVEQFRKEGKDIIAATGYNYTTNDYPQHGIHGLYFLTTAFGLDVESVSQQADGWWRDVTPTNPTPWTYGTLNVLFRGVKTDGAPDQTSKFMATQVQVQNHCSYCNLRVYASKPGERGDWVDFDARNTADPVLGPRYYRNFPTVLYMQRMFETGEMPFAYDDILKMNRIFLAAFKSQTDDHGQMVEVDTLSDDWTAPTPYPDFLSLV
ncbi:Gfo/Idh/MocA family oxidoreductase [Candidatus Latescibacterota bacterium]